MCRVGAPASGSRLTPPEFDHLSRGARGRASSTASLGPNEKRTWRRKREARCARRLPGFTSKNSPGTVITLRSSAARKNACRRRSTPAGRAPSPTRRTCPRARQVDGEAEVAQAVEQQRRASCANSAWIAPSRPSRVLGASSAIAARCSGCDAAAVEERARAGHRLDDALGRDRPGHAPARVAPVLGEAVEDHDRIACRRPRRSARRSRSAPCADESGRQM